MTSVEKFPFVNLPKLELHAHLNGSLSVETLRKLSKLFNQELPKDWHNDGSILNNLQTCFDIFKVAHNLTRTKEAVKLATLWTIQDFHDDNIIYLELRSTPRCEEAMTKRDYLESIIEAVLESRLTLPRIIVNLVVSINRGQTVEDAKENLDLALELRKSHPDIISGIDFSGDPTKNAFSDFLPTLRKAKNEGLKVTLHCGEVANDIEVEEMLDFLPDRLGHVTKVSEDAVAEIVRLQIPVELCVTSNLKCGTVGGVEDHQLKKYFERSPFILGTDDKGVFDTTLSTEYQIVSNAFGKSADFFRKMNLSAVDFCFASEDVKKILREILCQS